MRPSSQAGPCAAGAAAHRPLWCGLAMRRCKRHRGARLGCSGAAADADLRPAAGVVPAASCYSCIELHIMGRRDWSAERSPLFGSSPAACSNLCFLCREPARRWRRLCWPAASRRRTGCRPCCQSSASILWALPSRRRLTMSSRVLGAWQQCRSENGLQATNCHLLTHWGMGLCLQCCTSLLFRLRTYLSPPPPPLTTAQLLLPAGGGC